MPIDTFGLSWGSPGAALLPASLRVLWRDEALPGWMARDLGLADGATCDDLGPGVLRGGNAVPERVINAVALMISQREEQIAEIWCVPDPWPLGLDPELVPWSTRTRNALRRAGLYAPGHVNTNVTFGQFLKIDGAGVRSALDFSATLETAMLRFDEVRSTAAAALRSVSQTERGSPLSQATNEAWAAQVSGDDPRFRQLLFLIRKMSFRDYVHQLLDDADVTGSEGVISDLIGRLPEIRQRIHRIEHLTIEDALEDLLKTIFPDPMRAKALTSRLGWNGKPPVTLEEAGQMLGVTRERLRQLESKLVKKLPQAHPTFLPALDHALEQLADAAPLSEGEAIDLTVSSGYSKAGFHPTALIGLADLLKREHGLRMTTVKGQRFITREGDDHEVRVLATVARKLSGASGAFSVYHAKRECAKLGAHLDEQVLRDLLSKLPQFAALDDEKDWWRALGIPEGRDRLVNLARKMLSAASPLPVRTIREGVFRVFKYRSSSNESFKDKLVVPPVAVLTSFFQQHESFVIDGDLVSSRLPLDYRSLLGEGERLLVDILRSSATGVLDRAALAREAFNRGLSEASFGILTSFSPVVERLGLSIWKIRGAMVHPAAVEAVRQNIKDAPRERRVINYGWTGEGHVWIAAKAPHSPQSMVVGIPSGLIPFIGSRKFEAILEDGSPRGTIASGDQGTLYGFSPFARAVGLVEGEVFRMTFDVAKSVVVLELVDEDALDDE